MEGPRKDDSTRRVPCPEQGRPHHYIIDSHDVGRCINCGDVRHYHPEIAWDSGVGAAMPDYAIQRAQGRRRPA